MNVDELKENTWNDSYDRCKNNVFHAGEEVVRFVSHYLRRRVGLDDFVDIFPGAGGERILDVGCGAGRNLIFGAEMGFEMYGNDLSLKAVTVAREWLAKKIGSEAETRVVAVDILSLPWEDQFFDHAISDSSLDSMRFETAQEGLTELARLVKPGGYFYCSLISGDQTGYDSNYCGEEMVTSGQEGNTVKSYFNRTKIRRLVEPLFEILSCQLHKVSDPTNKTCHGRWHVVSRRRQL